jgi:hypothetical protein
VRAQVTVLRVLGQLGQVYSCMRVRALADLVPFMTFAEVEHLIVAAVKHGHLQVPGPCLVHLNPRVGGKTLLLRLDRPCRRRCFHGRFCTIAVLQLEEGRRV